jgi:hypothetical protein
MLTTEKVKIFMSLDLFTPMVPSDRFHPNFECIYDSDLYKAERNTIQTWAANFIDRDGKNKFVKEFQTVFNSCFWELYLFQCFKEAGWVIDLKYDRPDFLVSTPSGEIVFEAVTANAPEGFRPEWARGLDVIEAVNNIDMEAVLRLSTLRLSQAIMAKQEKYVKGYRELDHVKSKPFVICIAPFEQPFFFLQGNLAMTRVLYGFDQPLYMQNPANGELIFSGTANSLKVQKKPNVDINLGLFTRPDMQEVSAVLFSTTATFCKVRAMSKTDYPIIFNAIRYAEDKDPPADFIQASQSDYSESIFDGLQVFLNPFAAVPLNPAIFNGKRVLIHTYNPYKKVYDLTIPDGFLYHRQCISVVTTSYKPSFEKVKTIVKKSSAGSFNQLPLEIWPEGELHSVGGESFVTEHHYMGHYKGWTLLVMLDKFDNDWSAIAKNQLFYRLPSFIAANEVSGVVCTAPIVSISSKGAAANAIKKIVDQLKSKQD